MYSKYRLAPKRGSAVPALKFGFFAFLLTSVLSATPAQAAPQMVELATDNSGTSFQARVWGSEIEKPKAVLIAVHGITEYSADFAYLGEWFSQNNVTTYAYDLRGFGETTSHGVWAGADQLSQDLSGVIAAVSGKHVSVPLYVLGHAEGALLALSAVKPSDVVSVNGVIALAPTYLTTETQSGLVRKIGEVLPNIPLTAVDHLIRKYPAGSTHEGDVSTYGTTDNVTWLKGWDSSSVHIKTPSAEMINGVAELGDLALENLVNLRTRVFVGYGAQDDVVSLGDIKSLVGAFETRPRLAVYDQGYHMLHIDQQRETVFDDILFWLNDRIRMLPSDADRDVMAKLYPIGDK